MADGGAMESTHAVLLIDGDAGLHDALTRALGNELAVLGARTLATALKLAKRRPPSVAVLDAHLTGHTPESVVGQLRGIAPAVRIVLLSERGDSGATARLTALGTLLSRPVDVDRMVQAVRHAVRLQGMSAGVEELRSRTGQFSVLPPGGTPVPDDSTSAKG